MPTGGVGIFYRGPLNRVPAWLQHVLGYRRGQEWEHQLRRGREQVARTVPHPLSHVVGRHGGSHPCSVPARHPLRCTHVVVPLGGKRRRLLPVHVRQDWHVDQERVTGTSGAAQVERPPQGSQDRKSTRLNSSHVAISYAVFCLKKKIITIFS